MLVFWFLVNISCWVLMSCRFFWNCSGDSDVVVWKWWWKVDVFMFVLFVSWFIGSGLVNFVCNSVIVCVMRCDWLLG